MLPTTERKTYYNLVQPKFLSWEFIEPYTKLEPKFGELGLVVYYRTYSRYIEKLKRRESWWEMILRVVEYSMSLYPKDKYPQSLDEWNKGSTLTNEEVKRNGMFWALEAEAMELFDAIFHMKVFPAGRTLWSGGIANLNKHGDSQFNCSFTTLDSIKSYADIFHLLLVGAGTGYSVEEKYISQLPTFRSNVEVVHKSYNEVPKHKREEETIVLLKPDKKELEITVGDSRRGWENSLYSFLDWLSDPRDDFDKLVLVYDNIRPQGERLKTMGGRASGYLPLKQMFEEIDYIIKNCEGKLTSVSAMDIANNIAKAVVVAGVRRSSQIALGDVSDKEFISAKENLWSDSAKVRYQTSRVMSNNSVMFWKKPSKKRLREIFEKIKELGEPGFYNAEAAAKRRPNFKGTNPCGEILLDKYGTCNLSEVNVRAFVLGRNKFDYKGFKRAVQLATRMGSRITNVTMWDSDWDLVQKRDRLLGVSLTGQVEAWDALGWGYIMNDTYTWAHGFLGLPLNLEEPNYTYLKDDRIANVLSLARGVAREEADLYHDEMNIPRALLVTTVKPSGTISQLPGVSSGIHRPYSPYYLRNIRVSKNDPVARALRFLEVPCHPENGQGEDLDAQICNTWVFTFPVQTDAPVRGIDERAVDQLERYKMVMDNYVEHNCSVTISVAEHEWDEVIDWLYEDENWNSFVGVSFIPRFDAQSAPYPQMPYISCTKEQCEEAKVNIDSFTEEEFQTLIASFENEANEYELDSECGGKSFCPVR